MSSINNVEAFRARVIRTLDNLQWQRVREWMSWLPNCPTNIEVIRRYPVLSATEPLLMVFLLVTIFQEDTGFVITSQRIDEEVLAFLQVLLHYEEYGTDHESSDNDSSWNGEDIDDDESLEE